MNGRRYRCKACGNLTRFDVVITRTTREYHHFSISGELSVEDTQVIDEKVSAVICRWCGNGRAVEIVPAPAGGLGREPASVDRPGPAGSSPIKRDTLDRDGQAAGHPSGVAEALKAGNTGT